MLAFIVACSRPESPPASSETTTSPAEDSAAHTGAPPASGSDLPPTTPPDDPPLEWDCTVLPPVYGPFDAAEIDVDPPPFDTRDDGWMWIGGFDGIYEGESPETSTLVWPAEWVLAVREDLVGDVWFVADEDGPSPSNHGLFRVSPGGSPALVTDGLGTTTNDIELHPSGAVLLATWDITTDPDGHNVVFVDPTGAPTILDPGALPLTIDALAWAATGDAVWLLGDGLWSLPAEADGRPDLSAQPVQVVDASELAGSFKGDLEVDACGRVLITAFGFPFGRAYRYDPATDHLETLPGDILDQGYGNSPLRFGKAPGTETMLRTATGGWSTVRQSWVTWDVGVGSALR